MFFFTKKVSAQVFLALSPLGKFCSDAGFTYYCLCILFSQLSSFILIELVVSQVVRSSATPLCMQFGIIHPNFKCQVIVVALSVSYSNFLPATFEFSCILKLLSFCRFLACA